MSDKDPLVSEERPEEVTPSVVALVVSSVVYTDAGSVSGISEEAKLTSWFDLEDRSSAFVLADVMIAGWSGSALVETSPSDNIAELAATLWASRVDDDDDPVVVS
jgi:hypothetical protein